MTTQSSSKGHQLVHMACFEMQAVVDRDYSQILKTYTSEPNQQQNHLQHRAEFEKKKGP